MISLVDIGNSAIKIYLHNGTNFVENYYFRNDELKIHQVADILSEKVIITSVVPEITKGLLQNLPLETKVKNINHDDKFLFDFSDYNPINSIGIDRLLAMQGAIKECYDKGIDYLYLVVVTIGTATTINVVNNTFKFIGGMIFPGPELMVKSLNQQTSLLPDVGFDQIFDGLALNTKDAILSGVINSIKNNIVNTKKLLNTNDVTYFITGGYAYLFKDIIQDAYFDDFLIAKGLLTFKNLV